MEGATKERLTGAALVLLALVLVAPELLSGRHTTYHGTPQAQNPEEGAPLQTYNVQLDAASPAPAVPRDMPAAAAAEIAAVPPPVTSDAPPASTPTPASPTLAPKPVDVASAPPAPGRSSSDSGSARRSAPVAAGKWWVQLGSFQSRDNAQRLAQKLRTAGFTIDVSQGGAKGKEQYRVRAGPAADKSAASALQARLVAAGEKGSKLIPP